MNSWSFFLQENLSQIQRYIPKTWKQTSTKTPPFQQKFSLFEEKSHLEFISSSIKTFASQGNLIQAFKAYSLLQHSISSSTSSYSLIILHSISSLLSCCNAVKSFSEGEQLHAHVITLGFERHPLLVPKLVTLYANFGHLHDAHVITLKSECWYSFPWNLLISAYVKCGFSRKAIFVYKQMLDLGVKPDKFTYPSVLKACSTELDSEFGREVHKCIDVSFCELDLVVQNALLTMYVKCGELNFARSLFDEMLVKDVVTWNSMIYGYSAKGMWEHAFDLFERMRVGNVQINTVTWNSIAGGCLQTANYKGALNVIYHMGYHGVELDCVTLVTGLDACSDAGFFRIGKEIHGYAVRSGYDGFELVKNALIIMYSRCKDLGGARVLFQSTDDKGLTTWNSMIAGCIFLGQYKEASSVFRGMLSAGIKPNFVTVASILPFCARTKNLLHGKEIHCNIMKREEFSDHLLLWNSLVDMYSKSEKILEARRLFKSVSGKDKFTYTSLIAGYGMQGQGQTALRLFEEMKRRGIKPDHITMITVLSACSHSVLVLEGEMMFEKMIKEYGLFPQVEHFACMVDLYGRAGLLIRAAQIIMEMPFEPTRAMLVTLIKGCRIHGNTTILERAIKLLEVRPEE